jgi:hypothetical protein
VKKVNIEPLPVTKTFGEASYTADLPHDHTGSSLYHYNIYPMAGTFYRYQDSSDTCNSVASWYVYPPCSASQAVPESIQPIITGKELFYVPPCYL